MAKTTIEWTATWSPEHGEWLPGYTFNPWHGCTKVSEECRNCYAIGVDRRFSRAGDRPRGEAPHWGPTAPRRLMTARYWRQPFAWDRRAGQLGVRLKVFCASMADIFEDHPDVSQARGFLWELIAQTPRLDWLLLTKRIERVPELVPARWMRGPPDGGWPPNVWLGVSAGTQAAADERIPKLRDIRARRLFVSYEPALEGVDWTSHFEPWRCPMCGTRGSTRPRRGECPTGKVCAGVTVRPEIDWLICGAESGWGARPMAEDWARQARDQSRRYGVSFFLKQFADERGFKIPIPWLDGVKHYEMPLGGPA